MRPSFLKRLSGDHSPLAMPWMRAGRGTETIDVFRRMAWAAEWTAAPGPLGKALLVVRGLCWPAASLVRAVKLVRRNGAYVARHHGVSGWRQLAQMVVAANLDNIGPDFYYMCRLFDAERRRQIKYYVQEHEDFTGRQMLLARFDSAPLDSKLRFARTGRRLDLPVVPVLATFENEKVEHCEPLPKTDLMLKPAGLGGGQGIECWRYAPELDRWCRDGAQVDEPGLLAYARSRSRQSGWLLQPRLMNHPDLAPFSRFGLCTLRVVTTFRVGEAADVAALVFRMPVGNSAVDNYSAGNIAAPVDRKTGRLGPANAEDVTRGSFDRHPDTGAAIAGRELPHWRELTKAALAACVHFPDFRTIGWDVAMTTRGPVLVEANTLWSIAGVQMITGEPIGNEPVIEHLLENLNRRARCT